MFSITAEFLTSLLIAVGVSASVIHDTFTIVESLTDKVCPAESRLQEVQATNTLSCLAKAGRRSECTGVSYDDNTQKCYICDTFLEVLPESLQSLTGATFYYRTKGSIWLIQKKQKDQSASSRESKPVEELSKEADSCKADSGKSDSKSTRSSKGQKDTTENQSTLDKHLKATESAVGKECSEEAMKILMEKIDNLASQEYIESKFEAIVQATFDEILTKKIKEFSEEVKKQVKKEIESVAREVSDMKAKNLETEKTVDTLQNKLSDMDTRLESLQAENAEVKKQMSAMKEQLEMREARLISQAEEINNLEQYTRKNSVRIYGIDDNDAKETAEESARLVVKFLRDKLKIHISSSDIDAAHRLGKFLIDGNRPIICKFVSRFTKIKVVKARRLLKGSTFVVREDLTLKNAKLLENTSDHDRVKSAWSDEGRIIALLEDGSKIVVDKNTDLDAC